MYRALPTISETAEDLKARLTAERHRQKRQRLHALYLLASGQARSRKHVAQLLGVHRETVGAWLNTYASGGLTALLDVYVAAGKPSSLPPNVYQALEQRLRQPDGFASYEAIRLWLLETHQITIKYKTLHNLLRTKLKTKPKVVRPSHIKKPHSSG
jgi:transposase